MSFYGDITNTSRTHFQFDRVYANRAEMETYQDSDGIYAGRFVLVEYNNEMHMDSFLRVRKDENNNFYTTFSADTSQEALLTRDNIQVGTIVYESAYETQPNSGYFAKNCTFYKCVGYNANDVALFEDVVGENEEDPHITNYTIDFRKYGRGYDSTVWQKVYDGGIEKYIMVAELNTVIPTFDLQPDAPTQTPVVPHFDIQGSDIYYKLHHQPQWGFRVKSAKIEEGPQFDQGEVLDDLGNTLYTTSYPEEPYQSDETTEWIRHEYNPDTGHISTLYWHSGNTETTQRPGSWQPTPPVNRLPAAIYYNKAGFDPEIITKSALEDHILVEGTGVSGQQYSSHDAVGRETAYPDIQELSMMLPSIGNSISTMWDLIYGDESLSTEETDDGKKKRNLDIDWNSTAGLRMVSETESGFAYNTKQVSTLAGAINSVHDLMGMIVLAPSESISENNKDFAKTAEINKIYYSDGEYYHRVNDYEYDETQAISAIDGDITLSNDQIKEISYKTLTEKFKDTNPFEGFKQFPPVDDKFYYGTPGEIYQLETKDYPTYNRTYYATKNKDIPFFKQVTPIQFEQDKHYQFITENDDIGYYTNDYSNNDVAPPVEGVNYYEILNSDITFIDEEFIPYIKGFYYIYSPDPENGIEHLEEEAIKLGDIEISNDSYNPQYKYYTASIKNGELFLEIAPVFGVTNNHYCQNKQNARYYKCNTDFIPHQEEVLNNLNNYRFAIIPDKEPVEYFYIPNKYYIYTEDTQEYRICKEEVLNDSLIFWLRASNNDIRFVDLINEHYYVANTYYYQLDNGKMIIDKEKRATENQTYYLRDKILYVFEDKNNVMSIGMEWNVNVSTIPKGITVTTRKEVPVMKRLEGFARELNTIHGLILEINRLLLTNDVHTRDSYTVQGAINVINDIIDKFEIIAPGQFVIVDDYGRVHSATHSEDNWIDIEIDSSVTNPNVSITHKFNPVNDTTSGVTPVVKDNNPSDQNTSSTGQIELYTPIVDDKGHIVGKNIETIELPHNFKTITVGDTPITADNHIANMNITDDNNWIEVSANTNTDTITISHIGPVSGGITTYHTDDKPKFGATFNIPTITYDSKGHISATDKYQITLPTLSLVDNTSGNILTGLTLDISNTTGKLTLTKEPVGTLALGGNYAIATSASAIANTDTINVALGKLEYKTNRDIGSLALGTYAANTSTAAIASTDTIQAALRKLENRIAKLEK